jgi:hypothetical protein
VDIGDLTPSHNAQTFAKNPNYPQGVQERAYHTSKEAQNRVIEQAQNYDPRLTVNTDPTGQNGPPVVTPDGIVLGGNSRVMSTQRLYDGGAAADYKNAIAEQARNFGVDPADVQNMKRPMLVREVGPFGTQDEMRTVGKDLNKSMTGSLGVSERAVSAGKSLSPESLTEIGNIKDSLGEDTTLRDAMRDRGKAILDVFQRDGVITARERPGLIDTSTGGLNEDGKNFAEKALLGSVVDDPDLMDRTPKNVLNKLGSSLGELAALSGREDEYNLTPLIREAVRDHAEAAQQGGSVEDYLRQSPMFGPERSPVVEVLTRALGENPKTFRAALRSFSQDARSDVSGQGTMLMSEKPSATNAFNHAFNANVSEPEYREALRQALERSANPGGKL